MTYRNVKVLKYALKFIKEIIDKAKNSKKSNFADIGPSLAKNIPLYRTCNCSACKSDLRII